MKEREIELIEFIVALVLCSGLSVLFIVILCGSVAI